MSEFNTKIIAGIFFVWFVWFLYPISNDEIIEIKHKCESAGMDVDVQRGGFGQAVRAVCVSESEAS